MNSFLTPAGSAPWSADLPRGKSSQDVFNRRLGGYQSRYAGCGDRNMSCPSCESNHVPSFVKNTDYAIPASEWENIILRYNLIFQNLQKVLLTGIVTCMTNYFDPCTREC
jgi:hypothetical protein